MGANDDARLCNRLKESVLLDKHGWAHMVDKASGCDIIEGRQDVMMGLFFFWTSNILRRLYSLMRIGVCGDSVRL